MSNIWKVVSDVDRGDNGSKPQLGLNAVQTRNPAGKGRDTSTEGQSNPKTSRDATKFDISNIQKPEDALHFLRSEPDTATLLLVLTRLTSADGFQDAFDIRCPSPLAAQIINTLIVSTIPTFWPVSERQDRGLLLKCVSSVAGLNSVITRIQLLSSQIKSSKAQESEQTLRIMLDVAGQLFNSDAQVLRTFTGLQQSTHAKVKRDMAWKEYLNLLGSGKVTNVLAEAEDTLKSSIGVTQGTSLPAANGRDYSSWLGRNISHSLLFGDPAILSDPYPALALLMARSLSLSHPIPFIKALHVELLRRSPAHETSGMDRFRGLLSSLPSFAKRRYLDHVLRWLSSSGLSASMPKGGLSNETKEAGAIIAVLENITKDDVVLQQQLVAIVSDAALVSSLSLAAIRGCVAVVTIALPDELDGLVENGLKTFGDQLFVKHSPVLQQESLAQVLLIASGYIHRRSPMALLVSVRSSGHMQGISNRLDASNPRTRWLGMVVGTSLSSLVDKEGSKLSFGTEDMQTLETHRYTELTKINDQPSSLEEVLHIFGDEAIQGKSKRQKATTSQAMPQINGKPTFGPVRPPTKIQTEVEGAQVTELIDSESDEDDLTPYAKPDSDAEDSDEDATLVNRDKPRPPVYVRDLMAMLRDSEKHDRFQLGLKHAAPLIRRKTNFGREVTDHAEELARILCSLQDPFDTEQFEEQRLQALIAVILSDSSAIAPWLSRQAFAGEFSIAQRCVMLTALGLSGRELAGLREQDGLNPALPDTSFPSKQLPPHLHAIYSSKKSQPSSNNRLEAAHKSLEHTLLQPMALEAADKSTAHLNAVKVNTFSNRMAIERTKRKPAPNQLAKIFPEAYFYPLVNRYQQEIAAYGSGSVWSTTPFLLVTLIKTLALLFHASGPATLGLSDLSSHFWDLLLSLRVQAMSDITVLEALLFALLTVLEVNEDKQTIAQTHARQLIETQQWVDMVFERTGEGRLVQEEGQEETKVRTLAAAVLVKTGEVIEAHKKMLMGDMVGM